MKRLLAFTALAEAATGVTLLVAPALVGHLLLGAELTGVSIVLARLAGIALIGLGIGCWPGPAVFGLFAYNALGTAYLAHLALAGVWAGPLLWPAVGIHALVAITIGRALIAKKTKP